MLNKLAPPAIATFTAVTQITPEWTIDVKSAIAIFVSLAGVLWWHSRWMSKIERRLAVQDTILLDLREIVNVEFVATRKKRRDDGDDEI